jgi:actin-related protein
MPNIAINNEPITLKFDFATNTRPKHVPASVFIKAKYKRLYNLKENTDNTKGRKKDSDSEHDETHKY